MTMNLSLFQLAHPEEDCESLLGRESLHLHDLGIASIDGLELFSRLVYLDLSYNRIQRIENVEFLATLLELDVSFNLIDALSSSQLPPSLAVLNLSGNPIADVCSGSSDDTWRIPLQEQRPGLHITTTDTRETDDPSSNEVLSHSPEHASHTVRTCLLGENALLMTGDGPQLLDCDSVLEELVRRKCAVQNYPTSHPFAIDQRAAEMRSESAAAMAELAKRGAAVAKGSAFDLLEQTQLYTSRLEKLKRGY